VEVPDKQVEIFVEGGLGLGMEWDGEQRRLGHFLKELPAKVRQILRTTQVKISQPSTFFIAFVIFSTSFFILCWLIGFLPTKLNRASMICGFAWLMGKINFINKRT